MNFSICGVAWPTDITHTHLLRECRMTCTLTRTTSEMTTAAAAAAVKLAMVMSSKEDEEVEEDGAQLCAQYQPGYLGLYESTKCRAVYRCTRD